MSLKLLPIALFISFVTTIWQQSHAELVWIEKANFGGEARHRGVGFSVGGRGYMGLGHYNSIVDILFEDIWEYDPGSNTWTQKANFMGGKVIQAVAFTIGDIAYVGTGRNPGFVEQKDFYAFDAKTNTWSAIDDFGGSARHGAAAFAIGGKGYVGTGTDVTGYKKDL